MLRTACRQLGSWRGEFDDQLRMTVNLSPVQLAVANIVEVIQGILDESNVPDPRSRWRSPRACCSRRGRWSCTTWSDCETWGSRSRSTIFGTGYSTLAYLKSFAVDVIKIDRSFLEECHADFRDEALVRAILALGDGMQIEVVAEGVETNTQRDLLHRSGCRYGQGFLFAHPLPAEQIKISPRRFEPSTPATQPALVAKT